MNCNAFMRFGELVAKDTENTEIFSICLPVLRLSVRDKERPADNQGYGHYSTFTDGLHTQAGLDL